MGVSVTSTFNMLAFPMVFDTNVKKHMKAAAKQIATLLTKTARNEHRYNHQTGRLRTATMSRTIETATSIIIETFIKDGLAPHGKYIHNGNKNWSADPFIHDAINKNWAKIENIMNKHIDAALNESLH